MLGSWNRCVEEFYLEMGHKEDNGFCSWCRAMFVGWICWPATTGFDWAKHSGKVCLDRRYRRSFFPVKSCVEHFTDKQPSSMPSDILISINHLWKVNVPPNLLIFGWRFLLNRIPTKDQLFNRGILSEARYLCCVSCSTELKTLSHLFCRCSHLISIWNKVYEWMGILMDLSLGDFVDFFSHCDKVKCSSQRTIW